MLLQLLPTRSRGVFQGKYCRSVFPSVYLSVPNVSPTACFTDIRSRGQTQNGRIYKCKYFCLFVFLCVCSFVCPSITDVPPTDWASHLLLDKLKWETFDQSNCSQTFQRLNSSLTVNPPDLISIVVYHRISRNTRSGSTSLIHLSAKSCSSFHPRA